MRRVTAQSWTKTQDNLSNQPQRAPDRRKSRAAGDAGIVRQIERVTSPRMSEGHCVTAAQHHAATDERRATVYAFRTLALAPLAVERVADKRRSHRREDSSEATAKVRARVELRTERGSHRVWGRELKSFRLVPNSCRKL
jgi:hypothetical protein